MPAAGGFNRRAQVEGTMYTFRKTAPVKSVMFAVNYDDGRTAYFVVENHGKAGDDHLVGPIARQRQAQGILPEGTITSIKRVR